MEKGEAPPLIQTPAPLTQTPSPSPLPQTTPPFTPPPNPNPNPNPNPDPTPPKNKTPKKKKMRHSPGFGGAKVDQVFCCSICGYTLPLYDMEAHYETCAAFLQ